MVKVENQTIFNKPWIFSEDSSPSHNRLNSFSNKYFHVNAEASFFFIRFCIFVITHGVTMRIQSIFIEYNRESIPLRCFQSMIVLFFGLYKHIYINIRINIWGMLAKFYTKRVKCVSYGRRSQCTPEKETRIFFMGQTYSQQVEITNTSRRLLWYSCACAFVWNVNKKTTNFPPIHI